MKLTRRQFLRLASTSAAVTLVPWGMHGCGGEKGQQRFFSEQERAIIEAATARLIPTDYEPGAREARVVDYIDHLLSALDHEPPLIFAGGPFSGRRPFANNTIGVPSDKFPENSFRQFVPLSRVKLLGWEIRLHGSQSVPGGNFNDAILGPITGLQEIYRTGIANLEATSQTMFGRRFVEIEPGEQDMVIERLDSPETRDPRSGMNFVEQLLQNTAEGMYAPPEYGGNRDLLGWRGIAFDGDSQPLGYSIFSTTTGGYNEIPERPNSTPNPNELDQDGMLRPEGFTPEALEFINLVVAVTGGKQFF